MRRIATVALLTFLATPHNPVTAQGNQAGGVETMRLDGILRSWGRIGGIAVDALGFVYVSNFGERVWKISPGGDVTVFAEGIYGASGNALDSHGNLLQAGFFDNTVRRISRTGEVSILTSEHLQGPVGIAIDDADRAYVCNCSGNTISRVMPDGRTEEFAASDLFACPNGITFDDTGNLYVVSFNNDYIVRVGTDGATELFATVAPEAGYSQPALDAGVEGNAHIAFARDNFFVTKIKTNLVYRIDRQGLVSPFAGSGRQGLEDGSLTEASFAQPNGIAALGNTLYVNNIDGPWRTFGAGEIVVRKIILPAVF